MLKFLLCHIHFIQSYYNNGAIFSVYWLGPQTKIFPSSWFCLKEALVGNNKWRAMISAWFGGLEAVLSGFLSSLLYLFVCLFGFVTPFCQVFQ